MTWPWRSPHRRSNGPDREAEARARLARLYPRLAASLINAPYPPPGHRWEGRSCQWCDHSIGFGPICPTCGHWGVADDDPAPPARCRHCNHRQPAGTHICPRCHRDPGVDVCMRCGGPVLRDHPDLHQHIPPVGPEPRAAIRYIRLIGLMDDY